MAIGTVQTKYGKVAGVEAVEEKYAGITYFKGIPYAAPPVGKLRWKAPEDPECWEGIRVCDKYGDRAMQPFPMFVDTALAQEPYDSDFYYDEYPKCSEDCLYLNVTTGADSDTEKRPVFMWFHGGGLGGGHSYEVEFEPSELARKGVVVVTVGHRLNSFGYLALPQLSEEQGGISGNYGLLDEVKALDWVYENIQAFGGDPNNITVGGQSGGTSKTGALAGSPLQKRRVRRVIPQSNLTWPGGIMGYASVGEAELTGREFLRQLGIDPDLPLEELRKLPPEKFFGSRMDFQIGQMVCDGVCIQYREEWKNLRENASYCDFLSGGNLGEMTMRDGVFFNAEGPVTQKEYYLLAKERLGDLYEKYDFEKNFPCTEENADYMSRYMAAMGLTGFGGTMNNRYFGAYRRQHGESGHSYSYLFAHATPCRPEEIGTDRDSAKLLSWHSSELWYTFASLRKNENGESNVPPARPWTELDVRLADQISSYWANYMKNGDPNGEGLPFWPESDEIFGWMELGDEPKAIADVIRLWTS